MKMKKVERFSEEDEESNHEQKNFMNLISDIVESNDFEYHKLKSLIEEKSLCYREARLKTWPKLLGVSLDLEEEPDEKNENNFRKSKFYLDSIDQIQKDVNRSLWKYKKTIFKSDEEFYFRRKQLDRILRYVLLENPKLVKGSGKSRQKLFYFQGLHDVVGVFLVVCGETTAKLCVSQLLKTYYHDYVHFDNFQLSTSSLKLINKIVYRENPKLAQFIAHAGLGDGQYAISWIITWYSYILDDFETICRFFDVFLVQHPLFPIYVAASYILSPTISTKILSSQPEFSQIFLIISKFNLHIKSNPSNPNSTSKEAEKLEKKKKYEEIIQHGLKLIEKHKPTNLIQEEAVQPIISKGFTVFPFPHMVKKETLKKLEKQRKRQITKRKVRKSTQKIRKALIRMKKKLFSKIRFGVKFLKRIVTKERVLLVILSSLFILFISRIIFQELKKE